jgi:hypothetical protein
LLAFLLIEWPAAEHNAADAASANTLPEKKIRHA